MEYIREIQPVYGGALGELQRDGLERGLPMIPPETARLLTVLLRIAKPERILEIGCCEGFSAALMVDCLQTGGHLTTIDRYGIMIERAKRNFERLGLTDRVTLLEGDAQELLGGIDGTFDVIFMDAAKGQYIQFLPHCMRLLKVGGVLIADDVLQNGNVARDRLDVPRRQRTIHTRMNDFLSAVCNAPELETCIVPIGDGLTISYKKSDTVDSAGREDFAQ